MSDELDAKLEERANRILMLLANTQVTRRLRLRNPEFRKNLDRLYTAIRDTQRLRRAGPLDDHEERLERLLLFPESVMELNQDALGLLLEEVDQVLVEAGDEKLVDSMLQSEYLRDEDERDGRIPTWSKIHDCSRPEDLADKKRGLSTLLRVRHSIYSLRRAREGTQATRLVWLTPVLAALVVAFIGTAAWATDEASWGEGFLVSLAGAMGATVAAAFKVRDAVPRLADLRNFWFAFPLQVPLGAAAGLFLWVVLESGIVEVGASGEDWAELAVLAFVAGFSEPFLLGTVERIAGGGADQKKT